MKLKSEITCIVIAVVVLYLKLGFNQYMQKNVEYIYQIIKQEVEQEDFIGLCLCRYHK